MKILFWLLVLVDTLALGAWFALGLGFTGSSQVYTARLVNHFVMPVVLLVGSAALFVFTKSPSMRALAFVLALSPVLVLYLSYAYERPLGGGDAERALEEAIKADDLEAVRTALRKADVNQAGKDGVFPLTKAMDKFMETHNPAVLQELLAAGADPTAAAYLGRAIEMTKHHGTEPMILLLKAGAKPNAKAAGDPAFFAAAEKGIDVAVLQALVEHGADLRMVNEQGKTVLDRAMLRGNQPVVEFLMANGRK